MKREIVLVGKPNCGKSSLFNQVTGLNQKVANYSGATVEVKSRSFDKFDIIDIPGLKSLRATSPEEKISKKAILGLTAEKNGIVFVANGTQLEDSLMLFSEIADLQLPMVFIINFKDELEKNKIKIHHKKIEAQLGCKVVFANSKIGDGVDDLLQLIDNDNFITPNTFCRSSYDSFENGIYNNNYRTKIIAEGEIEEQEDDFFKRKKVISALVRNVVDNTNVTAYLKTTNKWDKVLLHPIYGLLIFLLVMYLVFQAVFSFSGYPMDWIDLGMANLSSFVNKNIPSGWLNELITDAIIPGIGGVVIFIPQIAILFFLLGLLEHVGYLSRISFISDAFLRKFGLSGKSVVPLMSSWACAIPAIMSTRIIDDPKERIAVILASPLMTCSARLPVYTILIAVILPNATTGFFGLQGLLLLSLYLLGVVSTLLVAWFINKRSTIESNNFWSLELPIYRKPNWKNILLTVYQKTKSFVLGAGKIIFTISILLWLFSSFSFKSDSFITQKFEDYKSQNNKVEKSIESFELEYSILGYMGKSIEPAIKPLGYDWKIGIAILTSFAAREVFVGTLSTIYSIGSEEETTIINRLRNEKVDKTGSARYDFATSISLLLFYVFAMQCMSTLAIVKRETGKWKYAVIQFVFMTGLAYLFALFGYWVFK